MFNVQNQRVVSEGTVLSWTMQGKRSANIPFAIQVRFICHPEKGLGFILDQRGTQIPHSMTITFADAHDYKLHNGMVVYLADRNPIMVLFEGEHYNLFALRSQSHNGDVQSEAGKLGVLYFHNYLPKGMGSNGDIIYIGGEQNFE